MPRLGSPRRAESRNASRDRERGRLHDGDIAMDDNARADDRRLEVSVWIQFELNATAPRQHPALAEVAREQRVRADVRGHERCLARDAIGLPQITTRVRAGPPATLGVTFHLPRIRVVPGGTNGLFVLRLSLRENQIRRKRGEEHVVP